MKRYDVNWGPFLGQAGGEVVCDGDVCRFVPASPAPTMVQPTAPIAVPTPAPAPSSGTSSSLPWIAVAAAAGVGALVLAFK